MQLCACPTAWYLFYRGLRGQFDHPLSPATAAYYELTNAAEANVAVVIYVLDTKMS